MATCRFRWVSVARYTFSPNPPGPILAAISGVRGARIGMGPRGAYVSAGRGGLYYRKYAGTKCASGMPRPATSRPIGSTRSSGPSQEREAAARSAVQ